MTNRTHPRELDPLGGVVGDGIIIGPDGQFTVGPVGTGGGGGGAGGSAAGSTISHFDFFGPESRSSEALTQASTGGYVWTGAALTSNTHAFRFDLGVRRAVHVNWRVVWVPNAAGNGMRLVHAENGPVNITQLAEFTGYTQTTPIVSEQELTTEFNALVDAGVWKNFGHQINAGATGPVIHASRLEVLWEGGSGGAASTLLMPLTTDIGGVPELVWGADNSLIPTEVPL